MMSRQAMIEELQRLMQAVSTAGAATRPTPWLEVDLSLPQLKALFVLEHRGTVRVGAVSKALGLSPNATTAVLDRLEEHGFVARRPDPDDRRAILVDLTDRGARWMAELHSANVQDFGELLQQLSGEELQALQKGLRALARALKEREARRSAANAV